jgi:hypothetical protein
MPGEYGTLGDMVLPFTIGEPFIEGDSDRAGRWVRESVAEVVMEVKGACWDWGIGTCRPVLKGASYEACRSLDVTACQNDRQLSASLRQVSNTGQVELRGKAAVETNVGTMVGPVD